jgi:hypothetical protein
MLGRRRVASCGQRSARNVARPGDGHGAAAHQLRRPSYARRNAPWTMAMSRTSTGSDVCTFVTPIGVPDGLSGRSWRASPLPLRQQTSRPVADAKVPAARRSSVKLPIFSSQAVCGWPEQAGRPFRARHFKNGARSSNAACAGGERVVFLRTDHIASSPRPSPAEPLRRVSLNLS